MERIRARANDPERRSDASSLRSQTMSLDAVFDRLGPKGEQLRSISQQLQGLMGSFGTQLAGMRIAAPGAVGEDASGRDAEPLPSPATAGQLAQCEEAIGRSLPQGLSQLYGEVADGGFGPGGGFFFAAADRRRI
jgi:hypothetical protein